MKTALLIPCHDTINDKWLYVWETPSEKQLSKEFDTEEEALQNRPDNSKYVCRDNGWNLIDNSVLKVYE